MQTVSCRNLTYRATEATETQPARPARQVEGVTLFVPEGEEPNVDMLKLFKDNTKEQVFSIQKSQPRTVAEAQPVDENNG